MLINELKVYIPVGKKRISAIVPDTALVLGSANVPGLDNPRAAIRLALENPISSLKLCEIAKGKRTAAIIVNDITRPYPAKLLLEEIISELNAGGIFYNDICLVVAYGMHRINTDEEVRSMFGDEIVNNIKIVHHFAEKEETLVNIGNTKKGMPIFLNKEFVSADVKIATGLISPHHSAGFSGGRKSVVPGIAGLKTLKMHHSLPIRPSYPAMGWLKGNAFHEEALEAARMARVDFIVNTIDNANQELIAVVAGDLHEAHLQGVEICRRIWTVEIPSKADVVIVSPGGYPRDFDLHQAQKAIASAELVCKKGGRIILCAEAKDGIGKFGQLLKVASHPKDIIDKYISEGFSSESTAKAYMYARALLNFDIAITETLVPEAEAKEMFLSYFPTLQDAIDDSLGSAGRNAKFTVIPNAADVISVLKNTKTQENFEINEYS